MSTKNERLARALSGSITDTIVDMVEMGLADDQNFPSVVYLADGYMSVSTGHVDFSYLLRDQRYVDSYSELLASRAYGARMLDGAMLQFAYEIHGGSVVRHRLAFLPAPDLLEYQNYPEVYESDEMYADVIDIKAVTVPLRFDFDGRPGVAASGSHPVSHLTLGQYTNCRIASVGPLSPYYFVEFVTRSFYSSAKDSVGVKLRASDLRFAPTITPDEQALLHVSMPTS